MHCHIHGYSIFIISVDNCRFSTSNSKLLIVSNGTLCIHTHLVSMECISYSLNICNCSCYCNWNYNCVRVVIPDCCIPYRLPVYCCRPLDDCTSLPYTGALWLYDCWDCFANEMNALNNSETSAAYDLLHINYTLLFTLAHAFSVTKSMSVWNVLLVYIMEFIVLLAKASLVLLLNLCPSLHVKV